MEKCGWIIPHLGLYGCKGCPNKTYKPIFGTNPYNIGCGGGNNIDNDEGYFWTSKFDPKETIEKINYIYDLSEQEWKNNTDEIVKKIIAYDLNNNFLKKKLGLL